MGNHNVLELLVDLHDLEVHGGVHEYVIITDGLDVDLGTGEEGLNSEHVNDHTTLCAGLYVTLHNLTALICGVNHIPRFELAGFLVGDDELALAVLCALYKDFHLVTHFEVRIVTELRGGDDAF